MNRIARVACAAAIAVALTPLTPIAPASSVPDHGAREAAAATYKVIARIDVSEAVAGEDTVRITGKVRPGAAGQKVVLQQRRDDTTRWVKTGTARIKPSGRFVLEDDPSRAGVRYYRVLKPAAAGIKAGRSRELRLDVWGWEPLTWRGAGANDGVLVGTYASFGAVPYFSIVQKQAGLPGYVEYTLGGKVRALRATYALTDTSATGASGTVAVSVDGVPVVTHTLVTGSIVHDYVVNTTDAFRVRFDLMGSATPAGLAAVGGPEVLYLP